MYNSVAIVAPKYRREPLPLPWSWLDRDLPDTLQRRARLTLSVMSGRLRRRLYGVVPDYYGPRAMEAIERVRGRVLVFGAGSGHGDPSDWRGPGRVIVGVDIDLAIRENVGLDAKVLYDGDRLPFADASYDLCLARWVLEHLKSPETALSEIGRVLRPGGRLLFVTPNLLYFPYALSRAIPSRLHPFLVRIVTGRDSRDVFPTQYRANTRRRLRRLLAAAGFRERSLRVHLPHPAYLEFSLPTLLIGACYERLVNRFARLEDLRQLVVGDFEKRP